MQNEIRDLQKKLQERDRNISEQKQQIEKLHEELTQARAAAETELSMFNLEIEKEIARSKLDAERMKLQQQLSAVRRAEQDSRRQLELCKDELQHYKTHKKQANVSVPAYVPPAAFTVNNSTNMAVTSLSTSPPSSLPASPSANSKSNAALEQQLKQLKQQVATLSNDKNALIKRLQTANASTQPARVNAVNPLSSAQSASTGSPSHAGRAAASEEELNTLRKRAEALQSHNSKLQEDVNNSKSLLQAKTEAHNTLTSSLAASQLQLQRVQDDLQQQRDECAELQRKLDVSKVQWETQQTVWEEKQTAWQHDKQELTQTLESHQRNIDSLQQQLQQTEAAFDQKQQQLAELTGQHEALTTELHSLKQQTIEQIDSLTAELHSRQQQQQRDTASWNEQRRQFEQSIQQLHQSLDSKQQQLVSLQSELDAARADYESRIQRLQSELAGVSAQLSSQRTAYSELQERSTHELNTQSQIITTLQSDKQQLSSKLQEKITALSLYHQQIRQNALAKQSREALEKAAALTAKKESGFASLFRKQPPASPSHGNATAFTVASESASITATPLVSPLTTRSQRSKEQIEFENDLTEEISVALAARVEKLETEKVSLQDEINSLQLYIQQETYLRSGAVGGKSATVSAAENGKRTRASGSFAGTPALGNNGSMDMRTLLDSNIMRNRELEKQKHDMMAEIKKLKESLAYSNTQCKELTQQIRAAVSSNTAANSLTSTGSHTGTLSTSITTLRCSGRQST